MNDGFHFLDIVFFAMVAAFLVLRLRSVLGRRTGAERPPEQWVGDPEAVNNVVDLAAAKRSVSEPPNDSPAGQGLAAIRAADRGFDLDQFLGGARAAFEMILGAYAVGDKRTLQPLLAPEVYRHFADAIDARARNGETLFTELVGIRSVELVEARMEGSFAAVTVRMVSEQVNALLSHDGEVIEGSRDRVVDVVDQWTFRRDTKASDPNWALAATSTPEE
ncbi:translocase [Paramagnetospirillum kuznetsovii]|uniref:Translocase n=1 Tax=Paramagnetospirillum kuznetsovii TaxID=2053833 RepID=A0A364P315_9PROT|nr:Tim44/TimA family putative adaptor protein [Paramagnetospirillum kuznetsovii]RAU23704.1 translocase [Paramagnetospirillum kuznetsovii]